MHAIGRDKKCEFWGAEGKLLRQLPAWEQILTQQQGVFSKPPKQLEGVQEETTNKNKHDHHVRQGGIPKKKHRRQPQERQDSEQSGRGTMSPLQEEEWALD